MKVLEKYLRELEERYREKIECLEREAKAYEGLKLTDATGPYAYIIYGKRHAIEIELLLIKRDIKDLIENY